MDIIDLKWDSINLGITLDDYGLEPLTVENAGAVHQSYRISIRSSVYTQSLINCDAGNVPGLLIDLQEEIENLHYRTIVLNTIDIKYDFSAKKLLFSCQDHDPPTDPIPVHILMRLEDDSTTNA